MNPTEVNHVLTVGNQNEEDKSISLIEESIESESRQEHVRAMIQHMVRTGYGHEFENIQEKTKRAMQDYIIPNAKFVSKTLSVHNGNVAKVMKKKIPQYAILDIEEKEWIEIWDGIQKQIKFMLS